MSAAEAWPILAVVAIYALHWPLNLLHEAWVTRRRRRETMRKLRKAFPPIGDD